MEIVVRDSPPLLFRLTAHVLMDEIPRWPVRHPFSQLAATAAVEFSAKGFPVMELDGGWRWWKDDGFAIEK